MRKLAVLFGALGALVLAAPAVAATVVVHPGDLDGWTTQTSGPNASVTFVAGPETPPAGTGSARLATGDGVDGGDEAAQLRTGQYAGTRLADLTALAYSTYAVETSGGQAPYLVLSIDHDGDSVEDDLIFFEPLYQSGFRTDLWNQGPLVEDEWQRWNALIGGWWSLTGVAGAGPGADVKTLAEYLAAKPNSTIVNAPSGAGGMRLVQGFASPEDVFVGHVDAFTIEVNDANPTTFDFDPTPATTPPGAQGDCQGVQARVIAGSENPDVLVGGEGPELLRGLGGGDALAGVGGDDCLEGGNGDDLLRGGAGKDLVKGQADDDKVRGEDGKDRLKGADGNDRLNGGEARDRLSGGAGNDRLRGAAAKDTLKGNAGSDKINAVDAKRDKVNCGGGQDRATVDPIDRVSPNCERVREVERD